MADHPSVRWLRHALVLAALAAPAAGVIAAGCSNSITVGGSGGAGAGTSTTTATSTTSTTAGTSTAAGTSSAGTSTVAASTASSTSSVGAGGGCAHLGAPCTSPADCCFDVCTAGVCDVPACTSDGQPCASNAACCSGTCESGACAPLSTWCKTLGNACATGGDCCSQLCFGGLCSPSSFCTQTGDSCSTNDECCNSSCVIAPGKPLGTCDGPPMQEACALTEGMVCGGTSVDGGIPQCGGACCSRSCAPYAPTGVLVCQRASGCHIVGETCTKDSDCCGSAGLPGQSSAPVTCNITPPLAVGRCRNPIGCKPDGDVCKLSTMSCNASCDCCSGNCGSGGMDTCKLDSVGVPRCTALQCAGPGEACATSANCCGGMPCVPNPVPGAMPPYTCYPSACVPACGPCTIDADCCPGEACIAALGSAQGTCGPCASLDGGAAFDAGTCGRYGQMCATGSPCCDGVPCTGAAGSPCAPSQTDCACRFAP